MYSMEERVHYEKNQLINVICQIRFPRILSIGAKEPAEFQEAVRKTFPRFKTNLEQLPPKPVNNGGSVTMEKQEPVKNYAFSTLDGKTTLNLTDGFIALSTAEYDSWENFAALLDMVVAEFCRIYEPACFERVGLRYINAFSREELGMEGCRWNELLTPAFVGLLGDEETQDADFSRCTQDVEFKARGGCGVKLHLGPGLVKRGGVQEKTARYVMDLDVFMQGQLPLRQLTGALQTVHLNADRIFREAITEETHKAMRPMA